MAGTLREEGPADRTERVPVVIHVSSYEQLLSPPLGLFALGARLVIGRREGQSREPGLWLDDQRVSSKHVELERKGGAVLAKDLGTTNGTLLNGRPLEAATALRDGDLLELGRSVLCYRELPAAPPREGWRWGSGATQCHELGLLGEQLGRLAKSTEPVLLLGETGVGKEIAARFVHQASGRAGALVAVDCGALPETLFESTLFGHEKGAFTGATEPRVGDVARAHRGTLFLDEVGNLPMATQAKLLRVLETRAVRPVGGKDAVEVDVRWVAATNAALADETSFRSDLRFRLSGFVGRIPALRRRREDLGLLMAALLREAGVTKASLTRAAAARLFTHPWPGNVRQLRQVLRSAVALSPTPRELVIDTPGLEDLEVLSAPATQTPAEDPAAPRMAAPEREAIEAALVAAQGRVAAAARALGTSPRQLYRWLERLGLDPDAFRAGK